MKALRITLWAAALAAAAVFPLAAAEIPYLCGRVVDDAELLSAAQRARVTEMLKTHETRTGNQIAVLTVPTIHRTSIEEYALKVFEAWKLGQKQKDNGVLVVVVPRDRKMRIEVGNGLECALMDVAASRITQHDDPPVQGGRFRHGDRRWRRGHRCPA